ncbi:hypothetical protein ACFXJ8_28455 [Nonomuraea sp. NPDC059194]|uniref:hypothetical protein n=1 Tax=Nonomuraea sp. NPDC059194 TaxID=3346764 RepID=UPI0036A5D627
MGTRSKAVLETGSSTAARLLVGALAFAAAYAGVSAYGTASSTSRATTTVNLSATTMPITEQTGHAGQTGQAGQAGQAEPEVGTITVSSLGGRGAACDKSFVARSVVLNPDAGATLMYHWRLTRWSAVNRAWKTYQSEYAGFTGARRNVKWELHVQDNPGWYRIELVVAGQKKAIRSDRILVRC